MVCYSCLHEGQEAGALKAQEHIGQGNLEMPTLAAKTACHYTIYNDWLPFAGQLLVYKRACGSLSHASSV